MSVEFLRQLPLLAGLSDEDLAQLYELAVPIELSKGEVLMEEGSPGDSLYVVLEGEFEITKRAGEKDVVIAERGAGEVMGEMALLSDAPRSATVTALGPVQLLRIDKGSFHSVLRSSSEAALTILDTVTERLQNTELMLRHHQKLGALGTLAAGLAHEINNPAGAIQRAAEGLAELVVELPDAGRRVGALVAADEGRQELERLMAVLAEGRTVTLDSLERSDREEELQAWLESQGVEGAWRMAGSLVSGGWTPADLAPAAEVFGQEELQAIVHWLAQTSEALALTEEVAHASGRIASIVQSVKDYTYLDQGPEQVVDIHQGIEDTLVILRHKMGDGIVVKKEYAEGLPRVEGFGSELTQVWTNLVDNAIDAMEEEGTLTLTTGVTRGGVEVMVCDDGPGIPPEHADRIFEPFYTTKGPGAGTGLGLHLVYKIVVQRHKGSIEVESEPGRTCFRVTLPTQE